MSSFEVSLSVLFSCEKGDNHLGIWIVSLDFFIAFTLKKWSLFFVEPILISELYFLNEIIKLIRRKKENKEIEREKRIKKVKNDHEKARIK